MWSSFKVIFTIQITLFWVWATLRDVFCQRINTLHPHLRRWNHRCIDTAKIGRLASNAAQLHFLTAKHKVILDSTLSWYRSIVHNVMWVQMYLPNKENVGLRSRYLKLVDCFQRLSAVRESFFKVFSIGNPELRQPPKHFAFGLIINLRILYE